MLRSRLRWRALAVLGALLSVMLEWKIGFAMPTSADPSPPFPAEVALAGGANANPPSSGHRCTTPSSSNRSSSSSSGVTKNCNASSVSVPSVNVIDSEISSNASLSDSSSQQIVATSSEEMSSASNGGGSARPRKLGGIHSKRKRKKHVYRVTAATLRSLRTQSIDSDSDSASDVTTIDPVIDNDNSTVYHFLSRTDRSIHQMSQNQRSPRKGNSSNLDRNERSANLSHISGPARKIQLYIKNRFIQLMPDGTVNGTQDDLSDYTILQRTTVDVGQIKIQGVATCLYLCMDQCGTVYGSKVFTDDCVFNESMEQHHYNTYSSTYNSNSRRTLYLALNRHGEPRKLQIPPTRPLGKLATYTKALTETVPQEHVEKLIAKTFGANRVKHGLRQLCDAGKPLVELTAKVMKARPKCNTTASGQAAVSEKLRISSSSTNSSNSHSSPSISQGHGPNPKRKKKKRRCRPDEAEHENCHKGPQPLKKRPQKKKCPPGDEECPSRRKAGHNRKGQHIHQQHPKQNGGQGGGGGGAGGGGGGGGGKKGKKGGKKGKHGTTTLRTTTTTLSAPTTTYPTIMTSTEHHPNEEDGDPDDIGPTSGENEEDEDLSGGSVGSHTNLVDSEELFYDGDFDACNMGLWRLVLLLWIATWSLRVGRCL